MAYNEDQPRDEDGKWSSEGGGGQNHGEIMQSTLRDMQKEANAKLFSMQAEEAKKNNYEPPPGYFDKQIEKDKARASKSLAAKSAPVNQNQPAYRQKEASAQDWDKMEAAWNRGNYIAKTSSGYRLPESFGISPTFNTKSEAANYATNLILHPDLYKH